MRGPILTQLPPDLILCSASCGADVQALGAQLALREAQEGLQDGSIKIIALIDTPRALLHLASFEEASPRLIALSFDGAALARALHAQALRDATGALLSPLEQARNLVLITARSCGLLAFDSEERDLDPERLRQHCRDAKALGFDGKLAANEDQARIISEAFA